MMAICRFGARSGGEGGPVGPSSRHDAATGLQIATPQGQGEKARRTALAARQLDTASRLRARLAGGLFRRCHAHASTDFGPRG